MTEHTADPAALADDPAGSTALPAFTLAVTTTETDTVLRVTGELDATVSGRVRVQLTAVIESGAPTVIVDLSEVSFCDSSGLSTLVHAHSSAEATGTKLVIVTRQRALLRPIALLGLDNLLKVEPDLESARAALSS